ncbi:MAG: hypothetical protein Q8Q41_05070 [bacterium]|nr:hypothetical protein [bacterium]
METNHHVAKLAQVLRIDKRALQELEQDLERATGKKGVLKAISEENERIIAQRLDFLGLGRHVSANKVYDALISKIEADDLAICQASGCSLRDPGAAQKLCDFVVKLEPPQSGFFLKKEKAKQLLRNEPPKNIMAALSYTSVDEMLEKEDLLEVYSALRFLEDAEWQNKIFFRQYEVLTPADFEERPIELRALHPKWAQAAERFVAKKYHNVSHLKELGVIFVIPVFLGVSGESLRLVSMLSHYLNEVKYYSDLFTHLAKRENFAYNVISLLRGDVIEDHLPPQPAEARRPRFLIIQRYLAKDDEFDWRLFEPHVNPEALHWKRAEEAIVRIPEVLKFKNGFEFWKDLGPVGDYFISETGVPLLVSFNIVDTVMALVRQKELLKYVYHHQEALWNKIFISYYGEEEMIKQIRENILKGYFYM